MLVTLRETVFRRSPPCLGPQSRAGTKEERPLAFFGLAGLALALLALGLGYPVLTEYLRTGLVPRFPTAILATGLMTLAFLSFTSGLVLETVTRGRKELKRLAYLSFPGPV